MSAAIRALSLRPAAGLLLLGLLAGGPSLAQVATSPPGDVCEPPISLCGLPLLSSGGAIFDQYSSTDPMPIPFPMPGCPEGYACRCVSSCPECDDCPVQVCVPGTNECDTACDCDPGLSCVNGRCLAGFAPVFCCDSDVCPAGQQCQDREGDFGLCPGSCVDRYWSCDTPAGSSADCGAGRVCACTASCPDCEDCGPPVCIPPGDPNPYRCDPTSRESCQPGDRCVCVSSGEITADCARAVCVPDRCEDPRCQKRVEWVVRVTERIVERTSICEEHSDCVRISTDTECRGTCGAWVNEAYARHAEAAIAKIGAHICEGYLEDGCPRATPACMLEVGACQDGRCVGIPANALPFAPPKLKADPFRTPAELGLD